MTKLPVIASISVRGATFRAGRSYQMFAERIDSAILMKYQQTKTKESL